MAHSIFIRPRLLALAALVVITLGCMFDNVSEAKSAPGDEAQLPTIAESPTDEASIPPQPLPTPVPEVEVVTAERASLQAPASMVEATMETPATEGVAEQSTDTAELITPTLSYQTMSREDEDRLNLIKNKVLSTIPTGREALQLMEEYDVRVEFGQRPGSFYIDDINLIVINTNKSPVGAALTFIHEMLHATRYHKGMRVDAASLSREDYVANRLEEEAEGETRVIAATMELEAIGIPYFTNDSFMEIPYKRSFEEAVASAKVENDDIAEEELEAIGREAGKQGIIEALTTGYVNTSTTEETYQSYYGQLWESLNR